MFLLQEVTQQDSKFGDRQQWTKEEDYRLLQMRQADVSVPEICIAMNRSFGSVETRLSRKGGGLRNTKVLRKQWTAAAIAKLKDLRAEGRDLFEIATALGRTESAVYVKLTNFGVEKKTALSETSKFRLQPTEVTKTANKKLARDEEGIRECLKCKGPFLFMGSWQSRLSAMQIKGLRVTSESSIFYHLNKHDIVESKTLNVLMSCILSHEFTLI